MAQKEDPVLKPGHVCLAEAIAAVNVDWWNHAELDYQRKAYLHLLVNLLARAGDIIPDEALPGIVGGIMAFVDREAPQMQELDDSVVAFMQARAPGRLEAWVEAHPGWEIQDCDYCCVHHVKNVGMVDSAMEEAVEGLKVRMEAMGFNVVTKEDGGFEVTCLIPSPRGMRGGLLGRRAGVARSAHGGD